MDAAVYRGEVCYPFGGRHGRHWSETSRVHHADGWRGGGVAARGARAAAGDTGDRFLSSDIIAKMLEALHELMPKAARIAALVNPTNQNAAADTKEAEAAARTLGLELQVLNASNGREIDDAFALLVERRAAALLIEGDPFFIGRM